VRAEIFDVDVAPKAGVEEQIPPGVMVVVVDIDLIAVPSPIAAAVEIVRSYDPIGIVIQEDVPSAVVNATRDENLSYVLVAAVGICAARADAIVIGIPFAIVIAVAMLVPALVLAIVVAIAFIVTVFVPTFMLSVVMPIVTIAAVVAILRRRGQRQNACQRHENNACKEFAHQFFPPKDAKPAGDTSPDLRRLAGAALRR